MSLAMCTLTATNHSAKFWLEPAALARNFGFSAKDLVQYNPWWNNTMRSSRRSPVRFTSDTLSVSLKDGRTITVPLAWYPKLFHASPDQLRNWKILAEVTPFISLTWTRI